jgi:hypothetical protein
MSSDNTKEVAELEISDHETETSSNEGNLNIIEHNKSGEVAVSDADSKVSLICQTQEFTEESATRSREDKHITDTDGMNESTETESYGASGGYVGSEEEFSNPCQPCLENDRNIDSLLYCVECEDYLCEKCVEMHRLVKPTKKHKLVHKDLLNNCGDELVINRKEECPIHMNEVIEWFCISDDKICCNICKATEHNKCESIVAIASVAETTNMHSIEEKIAETQSKLNDAIEKKNVDITNLDEDRKDSLQVLEQIKVDTVDTFQRLFRSLKKENQKVENIYMKEKKLISANIENCSRIIKCLNTTLTWLRKENICVEFKFIQMKKADMQIQSVQKTILDVPTKPLSTPIGYERDKQYNVYLAAFERFGIFDSDKRTYTCSEPRSFSVIQGKEKNATVFDICEVKTDQFLITDWYNRCIKLIDTKRGTVICMLESQDSPFGICKLEDGRFAVTITNCQRVCFIEVRRKFQEQLIVRSSFETGEHCYGISLNNERLFVACGGDGDKDGPGHIKMFDMEGRVLKTIKNDSFGKAIFNFPCKIKFLPGGTTAIVTDHNNLIQLDFCEDKITGIRKRNAIMSANCRYASLCPDKTDHVIIADTTSRSVKLLSKDYTHFEPIVTGLQNLSRAIWLDHSNLKLFVGLCESTELLCFQLVENKWEKPPMFD